MNESTERKTYRDAPAHFSNEEAQAWESGYEAGVADAVARILARTYPSFSDRNAMGGYRKVYADDVADLILGGADVVDATGRDFEVDEHGKRARPAPR